MRRSARSSSDARTARVGLAFGVGFACLAAGRAGRADPGPDPGATAPAEARGEPTEEEMAEARKHFKAGVHLLEDPDGARYDEAYHAFRKAYEISRSPKVLGNIGFCALKLERDGEAIDAYTEYLRETKDIDERERAQIERDLATLTSTLARVTILPRKPPGSFVVIDTRIQTRGAPVVNAYPFEGERTTLRVRPGRHSIKVKSGALESIAIEATIEPATATSHELSFPTQTPARTTVIRETIRPNPSYAGPIVVGGLGLAAIGAGIVTGLMARSRADEIAARCPGDVCPLEYDFRSDRSDAKTLGTIADASYVAGGVLAGGALVWGLLLPRGGPASPTTKTGTSVRPSAGCWAGGCAAQVGGAF